MSGGYRPHFKGCTTKFVYIFLVCWTQDFDEDMDVNKVSLLLLVYQHPCESQEAITCEIWAILEVKPVM